MWLLRSNVQTYAPMLAVPFRKRRLYPSTSSIRLTKLTCRLNNERMLAHVMWAASRSAVSPRSHFFPCQTSAIDMVSIHRLEKHDTRHKTSFRKLYDNDHLQICIFGFRWVHASQSMYPSMRTSLVSQKPFFVFLVPMTNSHVAIESRERNL